MIDFLTKSPKIKTLFEQKRVLILELSDKLKKINSLRDFLNEKTLEIEDELDDKGKKKYSNDLKRSIELKNRFPVETTKLADLYIDVETKRLLIKDAEQYLDFVIFS